MGRGPSKSRSRVPARGDHDDPQRSEPPIPPRILGIVALGLIVLLAILYVTGFAVAIAQGNEPSAGIHAILPVIGGAIGLILRQVLK